MPRRRFKTEQIMGLLRQVEVLFIQPGQKHRWTLRELIQLVGLSGGGTLLMGTPERLADIFEEWVQVGVDGFNLAYMVTPGSFVDFIDGVVPVLQKRGLMQTEYRPGTLREKLMGTGRAFAPTSSGSAIQTLTWRSEQWHCRRSHGVVVLPNILTSAIMGECFCGAVHLEVYGELKSWVIATAAHADLGRVAPSTRSPSGNRKPCETLRVPSILPRFKRQKPASGNTAGIAVAT